MTYSLNQKKFKNDNLVYFKPEARRRKSGNLFKTLALVTVILSVFLFVMLTNIINVGASEQDTLTKSYVSVKIEKGDSLWSIAEANFGPGYDNMNDYIKSIKKINRLSSDTIHAGGYIIVPKYVASEK